MNLSTFIFHVESSKVEEFKEVVASFFRYNYPDSQRNGTLTISNSRLIVETYDFNWLWCEVSQFVNSVLRKAEEQNILVVCESIKF